MSQNQRKYNRVHEKCELEPLSKEETALYVKQTSQNIDKNAIPVGLISHPQFY